MPAFEENSDEILGVIVLREMVKPLSQRKKIDLRPFIRQVPIIPDTLEVLDGLKVLREAEIPVALVHDEYGHFEGILTPADMLDAIAGAFRSDTEDEEPEAFQREDGSWLIAGWMPADEMAELLYLSLPSKRGYDTVAGFIIDQFQRIPDLGDRIEIGNWRFEIVDLDGHRVDKVLATRLS
jgi:putative hemolysin